MNTTTTLSRILYFILMLLAEGVAHRKTQTNGSAMGHKDNTYHFPELDQGKTGRKAESKLASSSLR
jgi:hypothetical protein